MIAVDKIHYMCTCVCVCVREREKEREFIWLSLRNYAIIFVNSLSEEFTLYSLIAEKWFKPSHVCVPVCVSVWVFMLFIYNQSKPILTWTFTFFMEGYMVLLENC